MAQELKAIYATDKDSVTGLYYLKSDVDAVLAEKDKDIAELKAKLQDHCTTCPVKEQEEAVLAEKDSEIRRLERALWVARAKRAIEKIAWFKLWNASISTMNPEDGARQEYDKWKKNLGKFLKKAEEYR